MPLFSFSTWRSAGTGRRGASQSKSVAPRSTPDKPPATGAGSCGILKILSSVKRNEMLFTARLTLCYLFHTPTLRTRSEVTLRTQQPRMEDIFTEMLATRKISKTLLDTFQVRSRKRNGESKAAEATSIFIFQSSCM